MILIAGVLNVYGSEIKDKYACKYETTVNICFRRTDKQWDLMQFIVAFISG